MVQDDPVTCRDLAVVLRCVKEEKKQTNISGSSRNRGEGLEGNFGDDEESDEEEEEEEELLLDRTAVKHQSSTVLQLKVCRGCKFLRIISDSRFFRIISGSVIGFFSDVVS